MSKICVNTNSSILIFVSTCKQLTKSEPTEFSKNGVFHSKGVVIAFSNYLKLNANLPTIWKVYQNTNDRKKLLKYLYGLSENF